MSGRPKGSKDSYQRPYKMSPKAIRQRQIAPLKDGEKSINFQKFLRDAGFTNLVEQTDKIKELIGENKEMLKLIQDRALLRQTYMDLYKMGGNIGLELIDDLIEIDSALNKIREKYKGKEDMMLADSVYMKAMEHKLRLNRELQRLNLDKKKFIADESRKSSPNDIIDVDFEVLD